jgi:MIP family channel proteins
MKIKFNPKAFVAEFIGTFALVFIGAGAAAQGASVGLVGVALAHGLVVVLFVYAYGSISGAHLNPAITLALAINKVVDWSEAAYYWVAQFLASMIAAAALYLVLGGAKGGLGATKLASGVSWWQGLVIEAILTLFLVTAVFHVAVFGKLKEFAGLVIGLTLAFCILFGGPLTGAAVNPARDFGPAIFTGTFVSDYWIYLVGPLLGGTLAAFLNRYMSTK